MLQLAAISTNPVLMILIPARLNAINAPIDNAMHSHIIERYSIDNDLSQTCGIRRTKTMTCHRSEQVFQS
jgi:hypothetical protein